MHSMQPLATLPRTEIGEDEIQKLRQTLQGPVLRPTDSGYDDARRIWNGMIDRKPALIARCLGVADVITCVNFARERGIPLTIKGGGHNISGLAVAEDALMLDMSLMREVRVDPDTRTAHAQAGCTLGDVDRETQVHGLAAVLGFISTTGIAGLTLGGGFGYLTRRFGWTCDNVRSMEVVTAEGQVVAASQQENPDLFWGLRGGGGNFGVVTNFEYELRPVGPEIMAGLIAWRIEEADKVLDMYRSFIEQAPPELTCAVTLRLAPPAPWLPTEMHGKPIVALIVCHTGSIEQAKRDVAPLKNFGNPVGDVVQPRPYVSQQSILDATQPVGRRYYWKSEYLPSVKPELLPTFIKHAKTLASPYSALFLFPIGGALNQLPVDYSAAGNRDAKVVLNITAAWEKPADDEANIEWARRTWRDMRRFSTGGTYVNFLTEEEGSERIRAAYGPNYERLIDVKTQWDPQNLFNANKNIPPRTK